MLKSKRLTGSEGKSGESQASFSGGRLDGTLRSAGDPKIPKGSGNSAAAGNARMKSGNGLIALIPPGPGLTGLSGVAKKPNGLDRVSAGVEECGRERRPYAGNLETGSRGERAKGPFEV